MFRKVVFFVKLINFAKEYIYLSFEISKSLSRIKRKGFLQKFTSKLLNPSNTSKSFLKSFSRLFSWKILKRFYLNSSKNFPGIFSVVPIEMYPKYRDNKYTNFSMVLSNFFVQIAFAISKIYNETSKEFWRLFQRFLWKFFQRFFQKFIQEFPMKLICFLFSGIALCFYQKYHVGFLHRFLRELF